MVINRMIDSYLEVDEGGRTVVYRGFASRKISRRDHVTHSFSFASHHERVLPSLSNFWNIFLRQLFLVTNCSFTLFSISGNVMTRTGTTASSTESGQGSEPLSDAFVAATTETSSGRGSQRRVRAPAGSSQMEVHRSRRVALSRSGPVQAD